MEKWNSSIKVDLLLLRFGQEKEPANYFAGSFNFLTTKKIFGGELGIRTPGGVTLNGFQDRRIRPLCQLSGANVSVEFYSKNKFRIFFNKEYFFFIWIRNYKIFLNKYPH